MKCTSAPAGFRGRYLTEPTVRYAYSEGAGPFRIVPAAVAMPVDRTDLCVLIRHAADTGIPLTPRGAGSGMPGGNVGPGIVVDLAAFDRPARVSLTQVANIGAAVTWRTVNEVGRHFGVRIAPDPASGAFCTIGGMIATNAAGARSLRSGSIRRWVRGIEFVSADGECGWLPRALAARTHRRLTAADRRQLVERLRVEDRFAELQPTIERAAPLIASRFPATSKNSAGYALDQYLASGDLLDLVIGSEGTLGFITRVELQLERTPEAVGTLLLAIASLDVLTDVIGTVLRHDPAAVELLDRTLLNLAGAHSSFDVGDPAAVLIVEFESRSPQELRATMEAAERAVAPACTLTRRGMTDRERELLWSVRHSASAALAALPQERRSLQIIEDGCVPAAALHRYLCGVHEAAREANIQVVVFGHAGDGHLHVNALVDTTVPGFERRLARLLEDVTTLLVELRGTPSGEHGDGRLRASLLERIYGSEIVNLFRAVKTVFDPAGILNPGVVIPANGAAALTQLKVGPNATQIPHDIAAALRRIERTVAWGTPRLTSLESIP